MRLRKYLVLLFITACIEALTTIPPANPSGLSHKFLYHWTLLWRPLCAGTPSNILCVFCWRTQAPQRRGQPHSGEGQNWVRQQIVLERRGYKKILLLGFQDIYKMDSRHSFQPDWSKIHRVSSPGTQIPNGTWAFSAKN